MSKVPESLCLIAGEGEQNDRVKSSFGFGKWNSWRMTREEGQELLRIYIRWDPIFYHFRKRQPAGPLYCFEYLRKQICKGISKSIAGCIDWQSWSIKAVGRHDRALYKHQHQHHQRLKRRCNIPILILHANPVTCWFEASHLILNVQVCFGTISLES